MSHRADPDLWEKARKLADKVYKTHSAYKSGYQVKMYKELGGRFVNKRPPELTRWFKEKWVNQRGEVGYKKPGDVYRPSKRVTKKTPVTWDELTPAEIKAAQKKKRTTGHVDRFKKTE